MMRVSRHMMLWLSDQCWARQGCRRDPSPLARSWRRLQHAASQTPTPQLTPRTSSASGTHAHRGRGPLRHQQAANVCDDLPRTKRLPLQASSGCMPTRHVAGSLDRPVLAAERCIRPQGHRGKAWKRNYCSNGRASEARGMPAFQRINRETSTFPRSDVAFERQAAIYAKLKRKPARNVNPRRLGVLEPVRAWQDPSASHVDAVANNQPCAAAAGPCSAAPGGGGDFIAHTAFSQITHRTGS